ncbi:MAG: hypothetical protein O7B81_06835 [Gammaproteobacteria bacterium]|nr:hypothetical protein [Gammaproteobacteria bacterium]
MIIHVEKDWRLRSDPHQWIVEKRIHGAKSARHAWKPQAYCKSFDGAVVWAGRHRVMDLPGEHGFDALPLLAAALDGIRVDVQAALEAYREENLAA